MYLLFVHYYYDYVYYDYVLSYLYILKYVTFFGNENVERKSGTKIRHENPSRKCVTFSST